MSLDCARGDLDWVLGKISSWEGLSSPGAAAQGSGGATTRGGI